MLFHWWIKVYKWPKTRINMQTIRCKLWPPKFDSKLMFSIGYLYKTYILTNLHATYYLMMKPTHVIFTIKWLSRIFQHSHVELMLLLHNQTSTFSNISRKLVDIPSLPVSGLVRYVPYQLFLCNHCWTNAHFHFLQRFLFSLFTLYSFINSTKSKWPDFHHFTSYSSNLSNTIRK